jgi:hypothetical protein
MKRFPWKGSYRSVPPAIPAALKAIGSDLVIVSAVKNPRSNDWRGSICSSRDSL